MDIEDRIKQINAEDIIWIIYLGIIALSFYSNYKERQFLINKDNSSKLKYEKINVLIFTILIVVYLYFLKESCNGLRELKPSDSIKKKRLVYLSFIASLLIAISGFIFLYIVLVDDDLDTEVAFN